MTENEILANEVWIEKYRPDTLDKIIGHEEIKKIFEGSVKSKNMTHLLFAGGAGTGKTTSAIALGKDLFGENFKFNFKELNASDERGIDTIRKLKDFIAMKPINSEFRIVFLDEVDNLTGDGMAALRRTMENKHNDVRFILSCNYQNKIIEPIQSRCFPIYFSNLTTANLIELIDNICKSEGLTMSEPSKYELIKYVKGDTRKIINAIQNASFIDKNISLELIMQTSKIPSEEIINQILSYAIDGNFVNARTTLINEFVSNGFDMQMILETMYELLPNYENLIDPAIMAKIHMEFANSTMNIRNGANPTIQMGALISFIALIVKIPVHCVQRTQ